MLAEILGVRKGVTAVIGGGGKTTLLRTLGEELARSGARVILATTTKFLPFPGIGTVPGGEREIMEALGRAPLVCAAAPWGESGKLAASPVPMVRLTALADYVLVEADGSAGLPLKAHAPHREAAHRPERYAQLAGCDIETAVTPEIAARVLRAEGLGDLVLVNQAETPEARELARKLAENLPLPVCAGSLRRGEMVCVS